MLVRFQPPTLMIPFESSSVLAYQEPLRHRGLCGKARYGSFAAAKRSVRAMQRSAKDRKYEGYLHPYVCKVCRVWHVGHTEYED